MIKKISYAFLLIIFLILLFNTNVFAVDYDVSNISQVQDGLDYCIAVMSDGNTYLLVPDSSTAPYLGFLEDKYNTIFCTSSSSYSSGSLGTMRKYLLQDGIFVSAGIYSWTSSNLLNVNNVLYSTCDIPYMNHPNDLFFQQPVVEETVIAPLLEKKEMAKVTKEIVGILPLILLLMVSCLGLTKGLKIIKNLIRSA